MLYVCVYVAVSVLQVSCTGNVGIPGNTVSISRGKPATSVRYAVVDARMEVY